MAFNVKQLRQLRARLKDAHIRERSMDDTTVRYLEGWHVIAEANRIFGFDGWHRETSENTCVHTRRDGNRYHAVYTAKVRIRVDADGKVVIREGSGCGEADTASPGQAHEFALKAAETDATKRALMTFGNAFGLSLYAGSRPAAAKPGKSTTGIASGNDAHAQKINGHDVEEAAEPEFPETKPISENQPSKAAETRHLQAKIDKSALTLGEPRRLRDPEHLKFVIRHGCVVCGRNRTQAHHLTFTQPNAMGRKVSDEFTVPLCTKHHRELHHAGNEKAWWQSQGIDPTSIARELWTQSLSSQRKTTSAGSDKAR